MPGNDGPPASVWPDGIGGKRRGLTVSGIIDEPSRSGAAKAVLASPRFAVACSQALMRGVTQESYEVARRQLGEFAAGAGPEAVAEVAEEVLGVAGMLRGQPRLRRALIDAGRSVDDLYAEARRLGDRFRTAGGWFGAWVGLVIGVKLIYLSVRRRRDDYQPDRAACVSCGRCFWYCPLSLWERGRG